MFDLGKEETKEEIAKMSLQELQDAYSELKEAYYQHYWAALKMYHMASTDNSDVVCIYRIQEQIWISDRENATILGLPAVYGGVSYEDICKQLVLEDSRNEFMRVHEELTKGKREAKGIIKMKCADGLGTVFEMKIQTMPDDSGKPTNIAVVSLNDITAVYARNQSSENYQRMLSENNKGFPFVYEKRKDCFTISAVNAENGKTEYKKLYFYKKMVLEEKICAKAEIPVLLDFLEHGSRMPVRLRLYDMSTEEYCWFSLTGVITDTEKGRLEGYIEDISEIKQWEEQNEKLQRVLNCLNKDYLLIAEIDIKEDNYYLLLNNLDKDFYSFTEEGHYSEANRKFSNFVADEHRQMRENFGNIEHLREALTTEKHIECEYKSTLGEDLWRRMAFQAFAYNEAGIPTKAILSLENIDQCKVEKLKQQQVIQEAYNLAEAASEAKTQFLSRMSHDIRTPLNAIVGMTAIAGTHLDEPEKIKDCLSKINTASKHLLALVNEVLDMSKIESGKVDLEEEAFSLADILDNMLTMVRPEIKRRAHDINITTEDVVHENVIGDAGRIQQVFINLLTNAVKYTPDGGKISIRVKERPLRTPQYAEYEFVFADNGIGMSEDFLQVIFDPFTRAEDELVLKNTGTGLGMSIARNLVRMMDGDIHITSEKGVGTSVSVTMHLKIGEQVDEKPTELQDLSVLIVDDDQITCESASILLQEIGMKAEWCLTGQEAVDRAVKRHLDRDDYQVIIIDWNMPQMDGIATVKEIRRQVGGDIPILIISAYDWAEIETEAIAAGVNGFITKPLMKSRLIDTLQSVLYVNSGEAMDESSSIFESEMDFSDRHILLAEDYEMNAEIAIEIIEMTGAKVDWARNGKEAVEMVKASAEGYYGIIFMDIQMPIMDGYEATIAIRALDRADVRTMPIIALTANAFAEDAVKAKNAGMNENMTKPMEFAKLEKLLIKYFEQA